MLSTYNPMQFLTSPFHLPTSNCFSNGDYYHLMHRVTVAHKVGIDLLKANWQASGGSYSDSKRHFGLGSGRPQRKGALKLKSDF